MAYWLKWVVVSRQIWVSSLEEWWNTLSPLGHFEWHWARQCTDTRAFYTAALYIPFFWISSVTTQLPLFWRTWTRALATLAHMCWPGTWAEIKAIVEPRSWLTARSVALISRKYRKGLIRDFCKARAPDCLNLNFSIHLKLRHWKFSLQMQNMQSTEHKYHNKQKQPIHFGVSFEMEQS